METHEDLFQDPAERDIRDPGEEAVIPLDEAETRETLFAHDASTAPVGASPLPVTRRGEPPAGEAGTLPGAPLTIGAARADPLDFLSGRTGSARYVEEGVIGRGGMGSIIRIVDRDIDRRVAMKVIVDGRDREMTGRFVDEARITGRLEHPNIVPVHELSVDARGRAYFTMKMVQGETLQAVIENLNSPSGPRSGEYPLQRSSSIFSSGSATRSRSRIPGVSFTATSNPKTSWSAVSARCW